MIWVWSLLFTVLLAIGALVIWRLLDQRAEQKAWTQLIDLGGPAGGTYSAALVAELPEPARRFFNYTIEPGTPLHRVVEIEMVGKLSLGSKDNPSYAPMRARQLIAPPYGFVWSLKWNGVSGSDGAAAGRSWTRFWLFNLAPVARASGPDHFRSSFGRLIADGLFWAPASMLPGQHVSWAPHGEDSATVIVDYQGLEQAVDLYVDDSGEPQRVIFQRWSDENPERAHQLQPFGGDLFDFKSFEGYRLPTSVTAGNHYGTEDYFPFFKAQVTEVRFPGPREL